jgi:hypothetical protein
MSTKDSLAIMYNDSSVLENFHVASSFELMLKPEFLIFERFEKSKYKEI